jgi:hypothetical protein
VGGNAAKILRDHIRPKICEKSEHEPPPLKDIQDNTDSRRQSNSSVAKRYHLTEAQLCAQCSSPQMPHGYMSCHVAEPNEAPAQGDGCRGLSGVARGAGQGGDPALRRFLSD